MEEYLPPTTKNWCAEKIKGMGYPAGFLIGDEANDNGERSHPEVYKDLRQMLREHISSRQEPFLQECEKPTGAWQWRMEEQVANAPQSDMDIFNEGRDNLAGEEDFSFFAEERDS